MIWQQGMTAKDWSAEVIWRLGVVRLLAKLPRGHLTVLAYHRIRADDARGEHPFDDGVFGPTVSQFREQIHWLTRSTEVIGESQLRLFVGRREPLPPRSTLVTFDDAYRDNFDLAFPVLQEFRVPAIFFVPTGLLEMRTLGWWDSIAYLIKRTTEPWIDLEGTKEPLDGRRHEIIDKLHERMKRSKASETAGLLKRLSTACRVPLPSPKSQDAELMTWEHVREVSRHGIAVGSHTHTHRVLTTLEGDEVRDELMTSKTILEAKTGMPVHSLAYPCGGRGTFDSRCEAVARECGYSLAFSFTSAVNDASTMSPFDVKRLGASPRLSRLAASVLVPRVFSLASGGPALR
jgi:peptidoglycan/xylan/chitin deacetylase (PgdA/CDA1 family)